MRNPFQHDPLPRESEADAGELFSELSTEHLSEPASASIRGSMLAALSATRSAVGHGGRFAFAAPAVLVPLVAIGAVSAATSGSPISAPTAVLESAASSLGTSLGIVSADATSPETNTGTLALTQEAPSTNLPADASLAPEAQTQAQEAAQDGEEDTDAPDEGDSGPAAAATAAHEDGNGCDDVLFANGEPPFATPGGPVGCEVGNSADHRQNGVDRDADDGEDQDEDTPDEGDDSDDGEDSGPSDAATAAHENGKGCDDTLFANGEPPFASPGGPVGCEVGNSGEHRKNGANQDDQGEDGDSGTGEEPVPGGTTEPAATTGGNSGHGNSGNAPGQQDRSGRGGKNK
jgi:hypothetical protein